MPDPDRVCAVVVTYDRRELLRRCLGALAGQTAPPNHVLVVDNASTDGTGDMVRDEFPNAELVRLETAAAAALLPLRSATFVSLLVRRDAIDRHGLPHAHYFIWSDDIEYTARVTRTDAGYVVPASVVTHATGTPYTAASSTGS